MPPRSATFEDFFGYDPGTKSAHVGKTNSIVRDNVEFGAKKFIKP